MQSRDPQTPSQLEDQPRRRRSTGRSSGPRSLEGLNDHQRQAVEQTDGPVLIVAGPGSGKTRVITQRAAHLARAKEVKGEAIMCMTFTNRAAEEMRRRIERQVGREARDMTIGTFHSYCAQILMRHAEEVGLDQQFSVWNSEDQRMAIKRAMELLDKDARELSPRRVQEMISGAKARLLSPEELASEATLNPFDDDYVLKMESAEVYESYQRELQRSSAVDFDDLIGKSVEILRTAAGARSNSATAT